MSGGLRFLRCDLAGLKSADKVYASVRSCGGAVRSGWLVGYNLSTGALPPAKDPRAELDALVPDAAAYIANEDGYTAWVNTRALAAAGIDANAVSPEIDGLTRDPGTHKPTGIVKRRGPRTRSRPPAETG